MSAGPVVCELIDQYMNTRKVEFTAQSTKDAQRMALDHALILSRESGRCWRVVSIGSGYGFSFVSA